MNFSQFGQQLIININSNLNPQLANVLRDVSLAVQTELVMATPVDTGNAKSNWLVSLNTPLSSPIAPYAPGRYGSTAASNEIAAVQSAQAVLHGVRASDTVFITSSIHYIQDLNSGWSVQAPDAFVEKAIQRGASRISAAANNIRFTFR